VTITSVKFLAQHQDEPAIRVEVLHADLVIRLNLDGSAVVVKDRMGEVARRATTEEIEKARFIEP
jgi:hypothetical protein